MYYDYSNVGNSIGLGIL